MAAAPLPTTQPTGVLVVRAIVAYKAGLALGRPAATNLERRFNAAHVLEMSKRLPLDAIATLLKASHVREQGLALARAGELASATTTLDEARAIYVPASLSLEARAVADTFQLAADAYLQYRRDEHERAITSLRAALGLCSTLKDEYGYRVEVRRVHLARNIVRVQTASGNYGEALRLAYSLLHYLEGHGACWPFPELGLDTPPDELTAEELDMLADQLLGEVGLLLSGQPATVLKLMAAEQAGCLTQAFGPKLLRAQNWLAAMRAAAEGAVGPFLTSAAAFFADGPGYLSQAWRTLAQELARVCQAIAPEVVAELDDGAT